MAIADKARSEACEVLIDQEIDEGLKQGKTPGTIAKEVAKWIEKVFEAKIPEGTLKKRTQRKQKSQQNQGGTNVPKESNPEEPQESQQDTKSSITATAGGKREGAGRPVKTFSEQLKNITPVTEEEKRVDDDFSEAFGIMKRAIYNARTMGWKTTSKDAALIHVRMLFNMIGDDDVESA